MKAHPERLKVARVCMENGLALKGQRIYLNQTEIPAQDPKAVGILAGASKLLADAGITIRQALVDDPELVPEPKLTIITGRSVPGGLIQEMLKITGVSKVSVS